MPNQQQAKDPEELQWLDLDDFTPGIFSASDIAFSTPPNTVPGPFAAPAGAADASATWQCIGLPQGGLAPLPGVVGTFKLSDLGITDPPFAGYVGGLIQTGVTINDEFLVFLEWQHGGNNNVSLWSGVRGTGIAHSLYTNAFATPPGGGVGGSPYMFPTRVSSANPTTTVGKQVIAVCVSDGGDILLYPDPAAPTVLGVFDFSTAIANIIFGHQNRIVTLNNVTVSWPTPATTQSNNDALNYTDPPNSETYPGATPSVIFVAEQPFGYGAVGSISAGELFMVKCRGGGVVISGDINNPTVVALPGVRSTGVIFGHADSNESGLFYCSQDNGAHLWGGGNVSQKISQQLDDNFFTPSNVIPARFFDYFCKHWAGYMLFSNNYLFDPNTGGWWRFLNPSTASTFWIDEGFNVNQFYAAITAVASSSTPFLYQFDKTVPASSYQWQSLPIRVAENRYVDLRQIVVRYSTPYAGSGNFTLQFYGVDAAGNVINADLQTLSADVNRPQMARFPIRVQSEDLTIGMTVTATTPGQPAPVIHSISLGYRTRQHAVTV